MQDKQTRLKLSRVGEAILRNGTWFINDEKVPFHKQDNCFYITKFVLTISLRLIVVEEAVAQQRSLFPFQTLG